MGVQRLFGVQLVVLLEFDVGATVASVTFVICPVSVDQVIHTVSDRVHSSLYLALDHSDFDCGVAHLGLLPSELEELVSGSHYHQNQYQCKVYEEQRRKGR